MSDEVRRERAKRYEQMAAGETLSDIPPALTLTEWSEYHSRGVELRAAIVATPSRRLSIRIDQRFIGGRALVLALPDGHEVDVADVNDLATIIAMANAAMNDEDPRKITRETVSALRAEAERIRREPIELTLVEDELNATSAALLEAACARADALADLADTLESYLPPR